VNIILINVMNQQRSAVIDGRPVTVLIDGPVYTAPGRIDPDNINVSPLDAEGYATPQVTIPVTDVAWQSADIG
jgi:hypothetical protein